MRQEGVSVPSVSQMGHIPVGGTDHRNGNAHTVKGVSEDKWRPGGLTVLTPQQGT